jgi:hypothetical protein
VTGLAPSPVAANQGAGSVSVFTQEEGHTGARRLIVSSAVRNDLELHRELGVAILQLVRQYPNGALHGTVEPGPRAWLDDVESYRVSLFDLGLRFVEVDPQTRVSGSHNSSFGQVFDGFRDWFSTR